MPDNQSSDNSGRDAFRNVALVVLLLALLTPLRPFAILLIAFAAVVFVVRFAYSLNRVFGSSLTAIVVTASCYFLYLQYSVEQRHFRLLSALNTFEDVSIRREYFPFPRIPQLSIGDGVSDDELSTILALDGLTEIIELYIDNDELTDASLDEIASTLNLNYIFIDCEQITDEAILDFERKLPNCTVIPYQRDLHDDGVDVYIEPPPGGE